MGVIDYGSILGEVSKKFKLAIGSMERQSIIESTVPTGMLATDLFLGGGVVGGRWYTSAGPEGAGKTTLKQHVEIAAASAGVPIIIDADYEGSNDPKYCEGLLEYWGGAMKKLEDMFGVIDDKGRVVVPPKVRYTTPDTAEEFFDSAASIMRRVPDKVFLEGQWWYAWPDGKEGRAASKGQHSPAMLRTHGQLMVEAENGMPQGLFLIDSYPMMFPDRLNEDESGSGMAAIARAMSENVPKVFSKLRKKNFIIYGVNQLRQRPAVMYGSPLYEPAGETLKFASAGRLWLSPRSVPHGKGQIETEQSVLCSGEDTYRYIHMKTVKNKTFTPYLEIWQRIWVNDGEGGAHGFDPVWDTYQYLLLTGQLSAGSSLKKGLKLDKVVPGLTKPIKWLDFKGLILLKGAALKDLCSKLGLSKNPKIREVCREQINDRSAFDMFFAAKAGADNDEGDE